MNDLPELTKIEVMSLRPEDVLIITTPDTLPQAVWQRLDGKITDWKKQSNITNKHIILASGLQLKVLRPEEVES